MKKIITFLVAISFVFSGCGSKKSVLPDDTLYTNNDSTKDKNTKIIETNSIESKTLSLSANALNEMSLSLGVKPKKLKNDKLYSFVHHWIDVPYLWGGETYSGIDCSALTQQLYQEVYNVDIPRTSDEMFWFEGVKRFKKKKYLKEGDLIFFRINKGKTISHVGVYLQNNKFVASGSSRGVQIEDLNSPYWISTYVASGRVVSLPKE
jgi:lipoprotein Spr